jgi:acetylglutamate kinase
LLTVVKVGGRLTEEGSGLESVVRGIRGLRGQVVVVHGGGSEITSWQERLGLPVLWSDGLRVTTPEGAQVTAMVLSGWINKRLVAAFLSSGKPALGLSGEDDLIRAVRKEGGRLGEVGEVVAINPTPVNALLGSGILPVISPVSRGPGGVPLNVNADEAAVHLAAGLQADRLLLVSDVPGVVLDGRPLPVLTPEAAADLVEREVVTGGMAVKVRQAIEAARAGVEVRIGGEELLTRLRAGTRVLPSGATLAAAGGEA